MEINFSSFNVRRQVKAPSSLRLLRYAASSVCIIKSYSVGNGKEENLNWFSYTSLVTEWRCLKVNRVCFMYRPLYMYKGTSKIWTEYGHQEQTLYSSFDEETLQQQQAV